MYTKLKIEYTTEDVAKLILAYIIRKNPVVAKLTNERFTIVLNWITSQTKGCLVDLDSIHEILSDYDVRTGKGIS